MNFSVVRALNLGVISAIFFVAGTSYAQNSAQSAGQSVTSQPAPQRWSGSLTLGRTNSLYNLKDGSEYSSWDISASASYILNNKLSLGLVVDASEDIKSPEYSDFSRLSLSLRNNSIYKNRYGKLSLTGSLGLPVSKTQRYSSLISSLGASTRFGLDSAVLFSEKFSMGLGLSLTRNIHTYETALNGSVNTQYSSVQSLDFGYSFNAQWSASASLIHLNTLSYKGTLKEFYGHSQELSYAATEKISLALGHQLGAPALSVWNAEGSEYNFKLLDDQNSYVYGSLTMTF